MRTYFKLLISVMICSSVFVACSDNDDDNTDINRGTKLSTEIISANKFAKEVLSDVYLWKDSIGNGLDRLSTDTTTNPIWVVSAIKHKHDRWTMLTDNISALESEVSGTTTTFGYDMNLYYADSSKSSIIGEVTYVYANSPAAKAGIKRGDILMTISGSAITSSNYMQLFNASSLVLGFGTISNKTLVKDTSRPDVTITAVTMYEDPVVKDTIVTTTGGNKVGYLFYTSYTLASIETLKTVFDKFKAAGVKDFVLDLRYNGGGAVTTAQALSSLLAPSSALSNREVYLQSIWNDDYNAYWKSKNNDSELYVRYATDISYKDDSGTSHTVNISSANLNLDHLYVLVGDGTASASEATITGLRPYMNNNVTLIGSTTYGKFCAGYILEATDYKYSDLSKWGMYVMIYRYADRNGITPCYNGFTPNYSRDDNPGDGYQLGEQGETLFNVALSLIDGKTVSKTSPAVVASRSLNSSNIISYGNPQNKTKGMLIDDRIKNLPIIK